MWVKVHSSSRKVVAICDENLLGKRFEQGIKQLQITESFYKGEKMSKEEVLNLIRAESSSATFNIVGKESVNLAIEAGVIEKNSASKVKNIPFILIVN